jgi:hypothetical protein
MVKGQVTAIKDNFTETRLGENLLVVWKFVDVWRLGVLLILFACDAGLEKELGELKDAT